MRSVIKRWRRFILLVALCIGPVTAFAWDGVVQGVPFQVDVTDGSNGGLRVYIGSTGWCNPAYNWAYLNSTDSNYSAYVAAILMAKATGASIIIYQTKDTNGLCHIGYLMLT
jgi:hypothetical protein